jgi:hypothetical protein
MFVDRVKAFINTTVRSRSKSGPRAARLKIGVHRWVEGATGIAELVGRRRAIFTYCRLALDSTGLRAGIDVAKKLSSWLNCKDNFLTRAESHGAGIVEWLNGFVPVSRFG